MRRCGKAGTHASSIGWECMGLQVNLMLPWRKMGEPQSGGRGVQQHATYRIPFESCIVNTGSFPRNGKESGQ